MNRIQHSSQQSRLPDGPVETPNRIAPTILIVDDDSRLALGISDSFREQGLRTLVTNDGDLAIAVAATKRPDFMVLDSRMPRRSGYLVLEYLATELGLSIPTVMLSENEGQRHADYARMLGALDFVAKPVSPTQVLKIVTALMKDRFMIK